MRRVAEQPLTADSLADPLDIPRYRNAAHAAFTIVREEGIMTLYRGVSLTALRQATNQGEFSMWTVMPVAYSRRKLHRLPAIQEMGPGLPTCISREWSAAELSDHGAWSHIWSHGAVLQRADRYDQDVSLFIVIDRRLMSGAFKKPRMSPVRLLCRAS